MRSACPKIRISAETSRTDARRVDLDIGTAHEPRALMEAAKRIVSRKTVDPKNAATRRDASNRAAAKLGFALIGYA